jgi:Skp family chaperone for outer membrane proteins
VAELLQKDPADLTPKEKILVKKLKKTEEDFEKMKAAAAENHQNRGQAWQAMQQQFHPS